MMKRVISNLRWKLTPRRTKNRIKEFIEDRSLCTRDTTCDLIHDDDLCVSCYEDWFFVESYIKQLKGEMRKALV